MQRKLYFKKQTIFFAKKNQNHPVNVQNRVFFGQKDSESMFWTLKQSLFQ